MRNNGIRGVAVRKRPRYKKGTPSRLAPNLLDREFDVDAANKVWATDITSIRTWRGWLYLAAVMDLFSRKIVGWSMKRSLHGISFSMQS